MTSQQSSNGAPDALVVGIGNTLRGDDALGPIVAQRLERCVDSSRVKVITQPALTPELAAEAAAASLVVFLDASVDGAAGVVNVERLESGDAPPAMGHLLGFVDILSMTQTLYGRVPICYLISALGNSFPLCDNRLGDVAATAVQPMTTAAVQVIESHLNSREDETLSSA